MSVDCVAAMVRGNPTYLWAAELVLRKHGGPLRAREIVNYAQEQGLFSDEMHSRTPQKSMQARLSLDILSKNEESIFVRMSRGLFCLREHLADSELENSAIDPLRFPRRANSVPYIPPRRSPSPATEHVLAIPKSHFDKILTFQGLRRDDGTLVRALVNGPVRYIPRTDAESTDDYKQVITYVLVTHGANVLSFRRGTFNRAAAFLRGSLCIGFGGHVADGDHTIFSLADAGVRVNAERELREEVVVTGTGAPRPEDFEIAGVINDNSTEVGRRHVGILLRYEVRDTDWLAWQQAQRGEASINQLRWIDALGEPLDLSEFEYWSQLCWRALFPVIVKAQPAYRVFRKKPFRGPHILVVVGNIGSGKSSATRYLTRNFGYVEVNSGRVLAKLIGAPPVPETPRAEFQDMAWTFMQEADGPVRLADALLRAAAARHETERVVIDEFRQLSTLHALKIRAKVPLAVLFVHAAPEAARSRRHTLAMLKSARGGGYARSHILRGDRFASRFGRRVSQGRPFVTRVAGLAMR